MSYINVLNEVRVFGDIDAFKKAHFTMVRYGRGSKRLIFDLNTISPMPKSVLKSCEKSDSWGWKNWNVAPDLLERMGLTILKCTKKSMLFIFNTCSNAPIPIYEKLAKMYPKFVFHIRYGGIKGDKTFCGIIKIKNGKYEITAVSEETREDPFEGPLNRFINNIEIKRPEYHQFYEETVDYEIKELEKKTRPAAPVSTEELSNIAESINCQWTFELWDTLVFSKDITFGVSIPGYIMIQFSKRVRDKIFSHKKDEYLIYHANTNDFLYPLCVIKAKSKKSAVDQFNSRKWLNE